MKYLNEILIAVGLSLLAYGFNQPWTAYHEAELQAIEFKAETEKFAFAFGEYARRVNRQIELYNSCPKEGSDCDREKMRDEVLTLEPESREWNTRAHQAMVESQKTMRLTQHFQTMKRIWFSVVVLSCLTGVILLGVGVRGAIQTARNR